MKNVVIAGASGGIGEAITKKYLSKGYIVHASYFTAVEITGNDNLFYKKVDIRDNEQIKNWINEIVCDYGEINLAINAVSGALNFKPFACITNDDLYSDWETIALGGLFFMQNIAGVMKKEGRGLIINIISSVVEEEVPARMSTYVSAKHALFGLQKSFSIEYGRFGIKAFSISPSFVETKLINKFPKKMIEVASDNNNGSILKPEDISELVFKIHKNQDKYKNGQNLIVKNKKDIIKITNI